MFIPSFSLSFISPRGLPTWRFAVLLLLCAASFASFAASAPAAMADAGLRSSRELDTRRIGRVGSDERSLLRLEWRADQSRLAENSLVGDMLGRLVRIETTTGELHTLIQAMPMAGRSTLMPLVDNEPEAAPAKPAVPLALYGLGGAAALLLTFLLVVKARRRNTATVKRRTAVSPAPTLVQSEPSSEHAETTAEKIDALERADILLATGLGSDAAKILMDHIRQHPKQALLHWIKLLEVYRKTGNRFQFEKTARELKVNYNIEAENWAQLHRKAEATLEDFSRLMSTLQELWSQPAEVLAYMRQLLQDNRDGDRDGFPQPVAEEIMLLIAIVKETSGLP